MSFLLLIFVVGWLFSIFAVSYCALRTLICGSVFCFLVGWVLFGEGWFIFVWGLVLFGWFCWFVVVVFKISLS